MVDRNRSTESFMSSAVGTGAHMTAFSRPRERADAGLALVLALVPSGQAAGPVAAGPCRSRRSGATTPDATPRLQGRSWSFRLVGPV
jgi:hypothetical protein